MQRGEVYWADLSPRSGSEQQGRRPVVLVSSDGFNRAQAWRSMIVVPVSTRQLGRLRTSIPIKAGVAGLSQDSVALCHQVTTLDRSKLERLLGVLPKEVLEAVEQGLKAAMDLP